MFAQRADNARACRIGLVLDALFPLVKVFKTAQVCHRCAAGLINALFRAGNGICNSDGLCDCNVGWEGGSCSFPTCYNVNNCSGNGKCIGTDKCQCDAGFAFPACDEPIQCPAMQNCSGNGICLSSSSCLCYEGYAGPSCTDSLCPSDCSNLGKCVGAHLCSCLDGWTGQDCSDPSCENLDFCSGEFLGCA